MAGELGKASLDLEANLAGFTANIKEGERVSGGLRDQLGALADISTIATAQLNRVKMSAGQGTESKMTAEGIISGVRGISDESRTAARELDRVKLTEAQAAQSKVAAEEISSGLNQISRNADQAKRKLVEARLAGGRTGVGVGPFGSGFGRVGLLGSAVGLGALTAPAAGPAAVGLLASIPVLAGSAVGALGALVLAFDGVGKAIKGDKKAFDDLGPAAKQFVLTVRSLDGWFDKLRQTAAANLFPGLSEALHSALSPGTVGAITRAVADFAHTLGQAAAAWGRYIGSAQFQKLFGPLMQAGARNLATLSDAALQLFDALGVLGRAAIPLTAWMVKGIDAGMRLADGWLRAKDATGQLGRAMSEAQQSLRAVGQLGLALLKVVYALGKALYPVAKIAVKDLTGGLNLLAGIIQRNQGFIRDLVGGALDALVGAVKAAAAVVKLLVKGLSHIVGDKAGIVAAITAISIALTMALGPQSAAILGVILAIGTIVQHWAQAKTLMLGIVNAAWSGIKGIFDLGVYYALLDLDLIAKGVVKAFSWIPIIGPKIKDAFTQIDGWITGFRQRGVAEFQNAGAQMGGAWGSAFATQTRASLQAVSQAFDEWNKGHRKQALNDLAAQGFTTDLMTGKPIPAAVPQVAVPSIDWTGGNAGTDTTSPFGTPPPFTKNVPKPKKPKPPPLIPPLAAHALALASADASRASVLGNAGGTAKRYLENELADLETAAKSIRAKYLHTTGKVHTELFAALTRVLNQERKVRKQIAAAIKSNRAAALAFAVEQAKLAVENTKEGSTAWSRAIAAEEKALKAEIAYYDKIAHNRKLSMAVRKAALAAELRDVKELKALMKPQTAGAAGANEAQFLSSFAQIVSAYAPNSNPSPPTGGGKTDTHLYEIKDELRRQTPLLKRAVRQSAFPGSGYSTASATAATG